MRLSLSINGRAAVDFAGATFRDKSERAPEFEYFTLFYHELVPTLRLACPLRFALTFAYGTQQTHLCRPFTDPTLRRVNATQCSTLTCIVV